MGRGKPVSEDLRVRIIEEFINNVSQRAIARKFKLSSSTVHNIIKRYRESGEIIVRKGQGRKPILNARALRIFRRHCVTHRNSTITDIATWAREFFGKPLSLNTVRRCIQKCKLKLYCSQRKPYINKRQQRRRLVWARAHRNWSQARWNNILWSDESTFTVVYGNNGRRILRTKYEKDIPECYRRSVQKPASVMVWGCISGQGMGALHICNGTVNAEAYVQILEQAMVPSKRRLFGRRRCIFQQDNAKPHTARITSAWLRRHRTRVLDWPACSPDLSPIENVWRIMKRKIRQRRPRTVEQLKTYIQQEWDRIPVAVVERLVSSMPRRLQSVIKRRGDATPW